MTGVAVVIPAYNEERRIPATLDGWRLFLSQQSYSAELLVVDDGSRDGTAGLAQAVGVPVLLLQHNQARAQPYGRGCCALWETSSATPRPPAE